MAIRNLDQPKQDLTQNKPSAPLSNPMNALIPNL